MRNGGTTAYRADLGHVEAVREYEETLTTLLMQSGYRAWRPGC
jgi:hypothetical protein